MPESERSTTQPLPILVVDDDAALRYSLRRVLSYQGYHVIEAESGEEGIAIANTELPKVILLDNRMGGMSGIETIQHLRAQNPKSMIILMTAFGTAQTAIEAMKFGAFDYIIKPFDTQRITDLVARAVVAGKDSPAEDDRIAVSYAEMGDYQQVLVGSSEPMQAVFKVVGQVAASDVSIMITGESGTGKELVARSIFQHSHRSTRPFVAVNCAAIPDNLIESELFGHEKGAFTGATAQRIGKFELCNGGTIFLDEVGDMSLSTQTKILRVLQEGEIQRVGGAHTLKIDVRMIAATNRDLEAMVAAKTFREDLYYRLNVVRLRLPALRQRKEDIPVLANFMVQKLHHERKTRPTKIAAEVMQLFINYDWPGNVRELENLLYRCAVVAQGDLILKGNLPGEMLRVRPDARPSATQIDRAGAIPAERPAENLYSSLYTQVRLQHTENILAVIEKAMIEQALNETGGNQLKAAEILGMTRATLRKRIAAWGLGK